MPEITIRVEGHKELAAKTRHMSEAAKAQTENIVASVALKMMNQVRQNASGRPGPEIQSGAYKNSIMMTKESSLAYRVFTTSPYANRLEFGFSGVDALGRKYNQPAFPHWQPAVDALSAELGKQIAASLKGWWK